MINLGQRIYFNLSIVYLPYFLLFVHLRLGVIEKELGEKDHEVCELELKLERMQQENVMLEERNKMLVVHIQSSGTSLQEQEPQVRESQVSLKTYSTISTHAL